MTRPGSTAAVAIWLAAFLAAGDFWKGGNPAMDLENTYALYNQLKLKF